MKKNILSLSLLLLTPVLVHPATEEGIIISKISMKPIPFNERRDPVSDSPFNIFDGDVKSAALYSDFSMEFEKPVTADKIAIINGNSSSAESFKKNNRLRDIEITLYTIEIKPDNNAEKNSDVKNENNIKNVKKSDVKKNPKTKIDENKKNKIEENKDPNTDIKKDKNINKTPEKIIYNLNDYMSDVSLYFVAETYADQDQNANKIDLDKVMEKINIQVLGEKNDAKDNSKKNDNDADSNIDKKKNIKKKAAKKTPVKKQDNKNITSSKKEKKESDTKSVSGKKETVKKDDKLEGNITKSPRIVKLENDREGRVLVNIQLKDSMEYQSLDLKHQYTIRRIDFRAMEDEYYKGTESDRTAITEIAFYNKGKNIPFQEIDTMKKRYVENYNRILKDSLSNMNFVTYENNDITMRLSVKEDGTMEFIDRYKCKNKGDSDCTSAAMPVMWRITDGRLYMRYHTIWRLWKYELDCQSDMINTENIEQARWMKIYFKSDTGFTDKYLDLVRSDGEYR